METIQLGKTVMVSDPCYTVPTWCQKQVNNVWPGEYAVFCKKTDTGSWGVRNSMLLAVHKDHMDSPLKWKVEGPRGIIGVDSGQAGIFDMSTYRVNPDNVPLGDGDISFFGYRVNPDNVPLGDGDISFFGTIAVDSDEEKWYTNICSHTLGEKGWGKYDNGVVSRSGIGDGGYDLFVARVNRKVVAFAIDFAVEESKYIDFEWFRAQVSTLS